jgi:adenosylcobinamide-GDP ribazoletransferase
MKKVLAPLQFLTFAGHFACAQASPEEIGKSAGFFPLVGFALGLALALLNRLLEPYLESEILGVVLITILIVMTGAIHLEGTQKTFDELATGINSRRRSESTSGIYGLLALLVIVLFKVRAVEVIGETRSVSLLLTPMLARWSLVIFLYGSAAPSKDSAGIIAENVKGWHLLAATVATLTLAMYLAGRTVLWIGLWLSLLSLLSRTYLHHLRGGITYNQLGTLIELSETLSLILFASI